MTAVLARILARYVAGAMIAYGLIDAETGAQIAADPDLVLLIGTGIAALTEGVYALAKRFGWTT